MKASKYKPIQGNLKLEYPYFQIDQITLVMDVLGGYSTHLRDNIENIGQEVYCISMSHLIKMFDFHI